MGGTEKIIANAAGRDWLFRHVPSSRGNQLNPCPAELNGWHDRTAGSPPDPTQVHRREKPEPLEGLPHSLSVSDAHRALSLRSSTNDGRAVHTFSRQPSVQVLPAVVSAQIASVFANPRKSAAMLLPQKPFGEHCAATTHVFSSRSQTGRAGGHAQPGWH